MRHKFTNPKEHKGKPLLEGFKILKTEHDHTSGKVSVHVQQGWFEEDEEGNEIGFQPLVGELIELPGETFDEKGAGKANAKRSPIEQSAYEAVVAEKGSEWAGELRS